MFTYYLIHRKQQGTEGLNDFWLQLNDLLGIIIEDRELCAFEKDLLQEPNNKQRLFISIEDTDLMNGHEFEEFVASIFRKMGYFADVTKGSGDQGIDIIAEKGDKKFGIQTKCYSNAVSNSAIQEAVAGIHFYPAQYGADAGEEFADVEGFGQVIVGSEFESDDAIRIGTQSRHHQDRHVGLRPDLPKYLEPAHKRDRDVEHHHVARFRKHPPQPLFPVVDRFGREAFRPQALQ
jgi:hypothetical protein